MSNCRHQTTIFGLAEIPDEAVYPKPKHRADPYQACYRQGLTSAQYVPANSDSGPGHFVLDLKNREMPPRMISYREKHWAGSGPYRQLGNLVPSARFAWQRAAIQ